MFISIVFTILGIGGGISFMVLFCWLAFARRGRRVLRHIDEMLETEDRCAQCADPDCPARDTGVAYPCPHFSAAPSRSCSTCASESACLSVFAGTLPEKPCAYWEAKKEKPL